MARLFENISDVSLSRAIKRLKAVIGEETYTNLSKRAPINDWILSNIASNVVWEVSTNRPLTLGSEYKIYLASIDFSNINKSMTRNARKDEKAPILLNVGMFANPQNAILIPSDKGAQLLRLARVTPEGEDATNDLTYVILDVIEEMRLLQPSSMVQVSKKNPDRLLKRAMKIVKTGFGQPSIFNTDAIIQEMLRHGKSLIAVSYTHL
ncbi:MAG: hypothetical protein N2235_23795, partial [Fischerella sp.]|nr:hypothetical protein [Fischerella sp.]